ncbi:hypothetical protein BDZ91DRAFT_784608 [Kalaharituber pfeilii]|nr:hypothetical protein BDZ91DRAFT_784608 [Kalaharituber pfeilii]
MHCGNQVRFWLLFYDNETIRPAVGCRGWTFRVVKFAALTWVLNRAMTVSAWPIGNQDEQLSTNYTYEVQHNDTAILQPPNNTITVPQENTPMPTDYLGIIGVGFPVRCEEGNNLYLEASTEYDKWASAAASTLMALIPTFLAFGPVKTSNIGLLMTLYAPLGCIAAAFTFGLPVTQTLIAEQAKTVLKAQDCLKASSYQPSAQRQSPMAINDGVQSSEASLSSEDVDTNLPRRQAVTEQVAGAMSPSLLDDGLVSTIHMHANELEILIGQKMDTKDRKSRFMVVVAKTLFLHLEILFIFLCISFPYLLDDHMFVWLCPRKSKLVLVFTITGALVLVGTIRALYERQALRAASISFITPMPKVLPYPESQFKHVIRLITEFQKDSSKWVSRLASWLVARLQPKGLTSSTIDQRVGTLTKVILGLIRMWIELRKSPAIVILLLPSPDPSPRRGWKFLLKSGCISYFQLCWLFFLSFLFSTILGNTIMYTVIFVVSLSTIVFFARFLSIAATQVLQHCFNLIIIYYDSKQERAQVEETLERMSGVLIRKITYHDGGAQEVLMGGSSSPGLQSSCRQLLLRLQSSCRQLLLRLQSSCRQLLFRPAHQQIYLSQSEITTDLSANNSYRMVIPWGRLNPWWMTLYIVALSGGLFYLTLSRHLSSDYLWIHENLPNFGDYQWETVQRAELLVFAIWGLTLALTPFLFSHAAGSELNEKEFATFFRINTGGPDETIKDIGKSTYVALFLVGMLYNGVLIFVDFVVQSNILLATTS